MIAKGVTRTPFNRWKTKLNHSWDHTQITSLLLLCLLVSTTVAISDDDEVSAYLDQVEKPITAAWKLLPKSDGLKVSLRHTLAKRVALTSVRVGKASDNPNF